MTTATATATGTGTTFLSRRALMLGLGAAGAAGAAALLTPRHYEPGLNRVHLDDLVPNAVGPWQAEPTGAFILPADGSVSNFYDQVITRRFTAPNSPDIMLLIAHGAAQSGLMRVHRPEICYGAAGFKILDLHSLDLPVGPHRSIAAQTFVGVRDDRVENVLYWTRIDRFFPRNLMDQRVTMLKLGLQGLIPDGVLVRISALGEEETGPALMQFARDMVGGSGPAERTLLLGPQDSRSLT